MRDEARPREHARSRSEEDQEPAPNIFFEPHYSVLQASAGVLVIGLCRLLYWWVWGE
jgi:hypothetical protein